MQKNTTKKYFLAGQKALKKWDGKKITTQDYEAQVIDMFCGCGGMSLGFSVIQKTTGAFKLIGGLDINTRSLETYKNTFQIPVANIDIRTLAKSKSIHQDIKKLFPDYEASKPLVLIGCAPCQGFSAHRKHSWDTPDERNNLVSAFAEVAAKLKPVCVVMENVPELLSKRYWGHFEYFRTTLSKAGYVVKQTIHNAASFGVPQERFRALVVAMSNNFDMPKAMIDRSKFSTVRDAIGDLAPLKAGVQDKADHMHKSANHRSATIELIKTIPRNGGSRPKDISSKRLRDFKGFADVYGRLAWDKPSITITHYARNPASGRFVHPEQHRGLTMREAARLQSFPDGFEFSGGFDDVFRQIGEAVPPIMAVGIAATVLANLRGEIDVVNDADLIEDPVNDSFAGVIAGIKNSKK